MIQELIFTSARRGLQLGKSGFCTVASTAGMAENVARLLESLSGYRHLFPPGTPEAAANPVNFSHLISRVGGKDLHIFSRVADAGLDYSGRSNKLAHHIACDSSELPPGGPAALLRSQPFETRWDREPERLPPRKLAGGSVAPGICATWERVTGDAGWGGALAEAGHKKRPAVVIVGPGAPSLELVLEALALLPENVQEQVTFSTFYTNLPANVQCLWRFVLADSPEAAAAKRNPQNQVIDCTAKLGVCPSPAADEARQGRRYAPKVSIAPPVSGKPVADAPLELADGDAYELPSSLLGEESAKSAPPPAPYRMAGEPAASTPPDLAPPPRGPARFGTGQSSRRSSRRNDSASDRPNQINTWGIVMLVVGILMTLGGAGAMLFTFLPPLLTTKSDFPVSQGEGSVDQRSDSSIAEDGKSGSIASSSRDSQPGAGQPSAGQPSAGQPNAGQPSAGQPNAGQPNAGQPSAGQPNAGQPNAGQPNAGQPNAGQPNAGQPSAGQPNAGQPNAGQPNAGQPNAGQPSANVGSAFAVKQIELEPYLRDENSIYLVNPTDIKIGVKYICGEFNLTKEDLVKYGTTSESIRLTIKKISDQGPEQSCVFSGTDGDGLLQTKYSHGSSIITYSIGSHPHVSGDSTFLMVEFDSKPMNDAEMQRLVRLFCNETAIAELPLCALGFKFKSLRLKEPNAATVVSSVKSGVASDWKVLFNEDLFVKLNADLLSKDLPFDLKPEVVYRPSSFSIFLRPKESSLDNVWFPSAEFSLSNSTGGKECNLIVEFKKGGIPVGFSEQVNKLKAAYARFKINPVIEGDEGFESIDDFFKGIQRNALSVLEANAKLRANINATPASDRTDEDIQTLKFLDEDVVKDYEVFCGKFVEGGGAKASRELTKKQDEVKGVLEGIYFPYWYLTDCDLILVVCSRRGDGIERDLEFIVELRRKLGVSGMPKFLQPLSGRSHSVSGLPASKRP